VARTVFIGDIQGCRQELERLLEALRFDPAADRLEPVGDLVNRGPDSAGCLRLLKSLGAGGVLGNHDLHLLRTAAGRREPRAEDTFGDVLAADDRDELLAWLAERPFAKELGAVFLIHAGIDPTWEDPLAVLSGLDPLEPNPASEFAVRVRYCDERGRRPKNDVPPPPPPFKPWFEHAGKWPRRNRTIVFGHWAERGLVQRPGLRGLDTGCVWGKRLTAWIAEEDRLVDVPAARTYARFDA